MYDGDWLPRGCMSMEYEAWWNVPSGRSYWTYYNRGDVDQNFPCDEEYPCICRKASNTLVCPDSSEEFPPAGYKVVTSGIITEGLSPSLNSREMR